MILLVKYAAVVFQKVMIESYLETFETFELTTIQCTSSKDIAKSEFETYSDRSYCQDGQNS